ncbi:hypothetical protein VKS41_004664 [Umbelopsis sp. WA50703]
MEQRVYSEDSLKYIHVSTDERQLGAVQQSNLDWADIVAEDDHGEREISSNDSPASSTHSVKEYTTNANFDRSTPRLFQAMLSSTIPNRGSASKLNVLAQEFSSMSIVDSPSEETSSFDTASTISMNGKSKSNKSNNDTTSYYKDFSLHEHSFPNYGSSFLEERRSPNPRENLEKVRSNSMKTTFSPHHFENDAIADERFPSFGRRESSPVISLSTRTDRSDDTYSATWKRLQEDKPSAMFNDFMFPQEYTVGTQPYPASHGQNKSSSPVTSVHRERRHEDARKAFDSQKFIGSRLGSSYSNPDLATTRRLNAVGKTHQRYVDHNIDLLNNPIAAQQNAMLARSQMQAGMLNSGPGANVGYSANVALNSALYQQFIALGNMPDMKQLMAMNGVSAPVQGIDMDAAMLNAALSQYMHNRSTTAKQTGNSHTPRRGSSSDQENNGLIGVSFEDVRADIYPLCKDQHGCRYFQRKLEEQVPQYRDAIFNAVYQHFVELMTDPFGNYLCQKLVEYCDDDQRMMIVEKVAPDIVTISLNMHGTRAIQKMIEFLNLPNQTRAIVNALNANVVTLIKDLNGNHVIQKCLNKMVPSDNQIIYNAVCKNCVEVATHRHGCCVLQRCIDHAVDNQKSQLVAEIVRNALTLVQDPFGNYVVQYVLDLGDSRYTDSMIKQFLGNVCALSVQKFSSNVIEKCIRVAEPDTRAALIEEMVNRLLLEKLLRDSYANYVVQTSLDYADPRQRAQLVECIRPLLPAIRNTPYGKRIQSKIHREQQRDQERHFIASSPFMGLSQASFPFNPMQLGGISNQNLHPHQVNNVPANMAFNNVFENQMGNTSMVGLHNVSSAYQYM